MSKTLWVVNLPAEIDILVESGQKVSEDEVLAESENCQIKAPVGGKVSEIGELKIKLEFNSEKITGKGMGDGRQWGEIVDTPELSYLSLDSSFCGKIILTSEDNLTPHLVVKAKALGVSGLVVTNQLAVDINWKVPGLQVDKEGVELIKKRNGVKCLLDADNNCLLIPTND